MKNWIAVTVMSIVAVFGASTVSAQTSGSGGVIQLVVPYSAGGPTDAVVRSLAESMSRHLGQTMIIDNKPGAGTQIAMEYVANARPDGLTILTNNAATVIQPALSKSKSSPLMRLVPVTQYADAAQVLVVRNDLPVRSVAELVDYAKIRPGKLNYGSAGGSGSPSHLYAEELRRLTGIDIVHIPFKGSPPALQELIAGRIDFFFDSYGSSEPFVKAGKVRILAQTSAQRGQVLAQVPTIAESGIKGYGLSSWLGLFVPANTSKEIVNRLRDACAAAMAEQDVMARFKVIGLEPIVPTTPGQFAAKLEDEDTKWRTLIQKIGLAGTF